MATRESVRYQVTGTIPRAGGSGDLAGLLDMLRYDNARVREWDIAHEQGKLRVTLHLTADRVEVERWKSFGITPLTDDFPPHEPLPR
jgi:hypothetical protein